MKAEHLMDERGIFIAFEHETREELSILQSIKISSLVEGVGIMKTVYDSRYPELYPPEEEE